MTVKKISLSDKGELVRTVKKEIKITIVLDDDKPNTITKDEKETFVIVTHDFSATLMSTLLKNELKPALGVTEVGAIALAAARAYDAVGGKLLHIEI